MEVRNCLPETVSQVLKRGEWAATSTSLSMSCTCVELMIDRGNLEIASSREHARSWRRTVVPPSLSEQFALSEICSLLHNKVIHRSVDGLRLRRQRCHVNSLENEVLSSCTGTSTVLCGTTGMSTATQLFSVRLGLRNLSLNLEMGPLMTCASVVKVSSLFDPRSASCDVPAVPSVRDWSELLVVCGQFVSRVTLACHVVPSDSPSEMSRWSCLHTC